VEIYVGTSGWSYSWNPGGFDWYSLHSNLNAVELNMSFYAFPRRRQILSWARKSRGRIRWAIKVNRIITHVYKLSEKSLNIWLKFKSIFNPLEDLIDFYLFQMPPSFRLNETNVRRLEKFFHETNLGERFALEVRDPSWITNTFLERFTELGLTLVSVDAPNFAWFVKTSNAVYLRAHGRTAWYAHRYTEEELEELAAKIIELKPSRIYVFFNNNHDMLDNSREMIKILENKLEKK